MDPEPGFEACRSTHLDRVRPALPTLALLVIDAPSTSTMSTATIAIWSSTPMMLLHDPQLGSHQEVEEDPGLVITTVQPVPAEHD
jgi:hypothetical protein